MRRQAAVQHSPSSHRARVLRRRQSTTHPDSEKRVVIKFFYGMLGRPAEEEWGRRDGVIPFIRQRMGTSAASVQVVHCARTWCLVPGRLSRTLSAARTPPCGRLMMVSDRVFTCDVIVDDRPCVLCVVAASGRAL